MNLTDDTAAPAPAPPTHAGAEFCSTRWSVVLAARDADGRREALETLCRSYWLPVYCFVRRKGNDAAEAQDMTQAFFVHLLEGTFFDRLDPNKGRFRGYLCTALKNHLVSHVRREQAQKRGGKVEFVPWDEIGAEERFAQCHRPGLDPEAAYDHHWALTLVDRACQRLASEQQAAGKEESFSVLRGFLSAPPDPGEYETAAERLGTSRKNVSLMVHRLLQRLGELVRMEVAETVADPEDVADEMRHLQAALRS